MASGSGERPPPAEGRGSALGWLGHKVARHPWYSLVLWIVIILVCVLPAANVGSVINGSFSNPLPSNDQSVRAQSALAVDFPHAQSSPSSAVILLEGPNITGPAGKNATLALTTALTGDTKLHNVSSVESLYSAYSGFLVGQVDEGWRFLGPALSGHPSLPATVNQTASEIWSPVSLYVQNWESFQGNESGSTPASAADWPAFNQTRAQLASDPNATLILGDF
jgi:hypothetical protein